MPWTSNLQPPPESGPAKKDPFARRPTGAQDTKAPAPFHSTGPNSSSTTRTISVEGMDKRRATPSLVVEAGVSVSRPRICLGLEKEEEEESCEKQCKSGFVKR
ncbi:uncharacterized protein ASCRUDRAFT_82192 [Ascoidea rubescens DSM 1968]|uniref:Uncharacterized protein n=1 Tax=Ascoidea rubescens DSM 1968 TaxID=1344418 RepID=A0A1D2VCA3_9ASCO|nr:hypothetical protein ASCRUDRAFT_82192 [Ascoidea rubescens DSM 1968]ODV59182.1 hypothetical protein ASCRUDRAFT_82192 [Ascoidea rubescens DSM 1968]